MAVFSRLQKRNIIILGSARGGTTWLSEIINYRRNYRYIFEPCRNKFTLPSCPFDDISPVPSKRKEAAYRRFFNIIFAGRIHNYWTDTWSPIKFSRRKIIKEVRINFLLNWLATNYPESKVIFLIRNPYAVCDSRLSTNGGWRAYFRRERRIINKMKILSEKQLAYINTKKLTDAEQFFASWCLENIVPLSQLETRDNVHILFYEDLMARPKRELRVLFGFLGEDIRPELWKKLQPASKSTRKRKTKKRPDFLNDWRRELSPATIKKLRRAAKLFGVDKLYGVDGRPNKAAFRAITQDPTKIRN